MSYQALYRVWRPQKFDDMVGQEVITTTLKNAIVTNQLSHAYLFAGPRGTGKTSAAKILSKAINCPNQQNGEPCNQCEICKSITLGTLNDVIEIDAASNNGVEEIRDVRDKAKYAPTQATYKIYIIDEVHMLSIGAFNALLKTLEEPPAHVIFILATTEPQKIPATIISRLQRFDFKRITSQDILHRMEYILKQKNLDYDNRALKVIAKAAEGGMRDALSILDQVLSFGADHITYDNALEVTGSVTKTMLSDYLFNVANHNVKKALLNVKDILASGKNPSRFVEDTIKYCQDTLLYQQSPELVEQSELGMIEDTFKDFAQKVDATTIYKMIVDLNDIQNQMHYTMHPDVYLDVLTVKLATMDATTQSQSHKVDSDTLLALEEQVKKLQQQVKSLSQAQVVNNHSNSRHSPVVSQHKTDTSKQRRVKINLEQIYPILDHATRSDLVNIQNVWNDLLQMLDVAKRAMLNLSKPVAASHDGVVVSFDYPFLFQQAATDTALNDTLDNGLDNLLGYVPNIVFVPSEKWPEVRKGYLVANSKQKYEETHELDGNSRVEKSSQNYDNSNEHRTDEPSVVKKAVQLFGKDIIDIKND
jgi:DNA polymerase III subunit gamma/tau